MTLRKECQYQHWWDVRRQQYHRQARHLDSDTFIQLPLPVFPPALDFDPAQFVLPPAYEDIDDVEKARCHVRPSRKAVRNELAGCQNSNSRKGYIYTNHASASLHRPIPPATRLFRHIRYTLFTVYHRLFTAVFVLNLFGLYILVRQAQSQPQRWTDISNTLATLASSNFLLAILMRHDYLINLLYRTAWLVPWSCPLRIRKIMARVYCYGGIHSGAAVAGTMWWTIFIAVLSWTLVRQKTYTLTTILVAWISLALLLAILVLAYPTLRARYHNTFELTHRFLGWASIILFWTQHILLTSTTAPSTRFIHHLIRTPTFWNLVFITALLIYPWLRLRRWTFTAHILSSHAIRLSFPNEVHRFSCLSISSDPLREWHPFATFPSIHPDQDGGSMVISDAGDWTRKVIRSAHQKHAVMNAYRAETGADTVEMQFYVKSHPKAGVLSLSLLFPRVLILTTGSGIGPALSSLLERPESQHARLVWSTRSPLKTYGADILALVDKADPHAIVLDTDEMGRPDLLEVAWRVSREERVEAVFVLSNEKVVKWVVGGLERRGVPAYGPIWDS
ncbi:hypothetical protein FB567DRAFT_181139 [Paraphoma chrysanthemicola]|uniref:Integral membrane protein TmpA n=1 Tax=Paraphoma chrysanthemicola TaxID=798071 RepID=A0A8K0RGT4_9PLEO|nr:hypothetical protein FB567DRAFT_181139 [Paraphoma chrysanthemicola]